MFLYLLSLINYRDIFLYHNDNGDNADKLQPSDELWESEIYIFMQY